MTISLLSSYTDDEFKQIVKISSSYSDLLKKLGYNAKSGDLVKMVSKRVQELNCDTSHFNLKKSIVRTEENIFIENSTAEQSTLRKWYKKGNYTEYKCAICGQEPFWNGKELTLILDHINGKNKDDRLENLRWVCPNCNQQLDTTGSKNPNRKYHAKKYYCIDCGKEVSKKSERCMECSAKARTIPKEQMLISREELKKLIRTTSFTQIGKQYGVSDNAIRKWCDKYNLPRKVSDIKKISDKDWELI